MKAKTALKRSKSSVLFLGIVVPFMWGLFACLRWWQLAAIAGFMTLYLAADIFNIVSITRRAGKDPSSLDEKIN